MPQRKSTASAAHRERPTTILRRSQRLLQLDSQHPSSLASGTDKTRGPDSLLTPIRSIGKFCSSDTHKKNSQIEDESKVRKSRGSNEASTGIRRSARLKCKSDGFDGFRKEGLMDTERELLCNGQKRVTRRSAKQKVCVTGENNCGVSRSPPRHDLDKRAVIQRKNGGSSRRVVVNLEKRMTRSSTCALSKCEDNDVLFGERKDGESVELGKKSKVTSQNEKMEHSSLTSLEGVIKNEGEDDKGKRLCSKRKRSQLEDEQGIALGWTKEQELALQRAYLSAKPTPQFWKKVSKMVPGKSAHQCFDKVHSDYLTPPQPRQRSRARVTDFSSLFLSGSKLLDSAEPNSKKLKCSKRKGHLPKKTVRQLLQKHYNVNRENEVDLFHVLEPTVNSSTGDFRHSVASSTPECNKQGTASLTRCADRSALAIKQPCSRLSKSSAVTIASPPVLKQIRNKALHEKYIDQLHNRDAKRKLMSSKAAKSVPGKNSGKANHMDSSDAIKAAKNALHFHVRDAISQFQHLETNIVNDSEDDEFPCSDEDDE